MRAPSIRLAFLAWLGLLAALLFLAVQVSLERRARSLPAGSSGEARGGYIEVARRVSPSVVRVERRGGGGGTGWCFAPGLVVTSAHVVGGDPFVYLTLPDRSRVLGKLVYSSTGDDVAVLSLPDLLPPLEVRAQPAVVGEDIGVYGYPLLQGPFITEGVVMGVDASNPAPYILMSSVDITGGNSGSPLVDMDGRVVGLVGAYIAGIPMDGWAMAIPIDHVMRVIEEDMPQ